MCVRSPALQRFLESLAEKIPRVEIGAGRLDEGAEQARTRRTVTTWPELAASFIARHSNEHPIEHLINNYSPFVRRRGQDVVEIDSEL